MMYYGSGMGAWGMVLMTLSGLLFWGVVIFGVVVLVRNVGRGGLTGSPAHQLPTPQQLLAERFARGEIDEDDYQRRLRVLGHPTATG